MGGNGLQGGNGGRLVAMMNASRLTAFLCLAAAACYGERAVDLNAGTSAPDAGDGRDAGAADGGPDAGGTKEFPRVEQEGDEVRLVNGMYTVVANLKTGYFDVYRDAV
ncbi:MAG: hypothetical protein HY897_11040, partial [Deltaproteobacteria bacterium]|nr:hypothetical protein [Deltaproteobacteria bacterium]